MLQPKKLFENIFDDRLISSPRLYSFSTDTIGKLTAANTANQYTTFITTITNAAEALGIEIGEVKSSLAVQKGSTSTLDEIVASFKTYMSENEGVIAKAVGGFDAAAYLAFYPQGVSEYSKASKTKLPSLFAQVDNAASTYTDLLGKPFTDELKAFATNYETARTAQQLQKGMVGDNRVERSANRQSLETELLKTIHSIAAMFPGQVEQCLSFFSFNLLQAPKKAKKPAAVPIPQ